MEITSVYHRPESEFAYLYDEKTMHIRLRTQKGDMRGVRLHYGDSILRDMSIAFLCRKF